MIPACPVPCRVVAVTMLTVLLLSSCTPPRDVAEVTSRPKPPPGAVEEKQALDTDPTEVGLGEDSYPYDEVDVPAAVDGRIWPPDLLPENAWEREHDFLPDSTWRVTTQRSALRLGSTCSAGFVSSRGLVLTNHHCIRDLLERVEQPGEDLLGSGFLARHDSLERILEDTYVDELLRVEDVTREVLQAARNVRGADHRQEARRKRARAIEQRMENTLNGPDSLHVVEVFETYSAVKYSAYVYRRHRHLRLVFAPDINAGFFGGNTDNFSWPRHTFDVALLRVVDSTGVAHEPEYWLPLHTGGTKEGESVFAVGNPGRTMRLAPVSVLEFERDAHLPARVQALARRMDVIEGYVRAPTDSIDMRGALMQVQNMHKADVGRLQGLVQGNVLPVRASWERDLRRTLRRDDSLRKAFDNVHEQLALVQESKESSMRRGQAFLFFADPSAGSRILTRALYANVYAQWKQRGATEQDLADIRREALSLEDWPRDVERGLILERLVDLERVLGMRDPTVRRLFESISPEALADTLANHSALIHNDSLRQLLDTNYLASRDVSIRVIRALGPLFLTFDQEWRGLLSREHVSMGELEELRYHIHGSASPPDASFTLRYSDGRIRATRRHEGAFTRVSGMQELARMNPDPDEWDLHAAWQKTDSAFVQTPLNFVSTLDITGGSSGSPVIDTKGRLVGIVFDSNIEKLPDDFALVPGDGRAIAVDVRAILIALDEVYNAERLLRELNPRL